MKFIQFRRVIISILAGITFLMSSLLGSAQANANPLTPEADSYQVSQMGDRTDNSHDWYPDQRPLRSYMRNADIKPTDSPTDNDVIDSARRNLKGMADTVRDKLNLDEPIYPGTKEFANDVRNNTNRAVEGAQRAIRNTSDAAKDALD